MVGVTIGGLIIDATGDYAYLGIAYGAFAFLSAIILHFFVVEAGDPDPSGVIQPD